MTTLTLPTTTVTDVLHRTALYVNHPVNASLPDALRTATRDQTLADQAAQQLADTLRLHPRDLAVWDVTRSRARVAAILRIAAQVTR